MVKYNPQNFEKKWQEKWFTDLFYQPKDLDEKPKYYLLVEFPYPSGPGMHIGHARNYSMMDTVARLRRMRGENVLYPMGWDAFGLPTENYAIKVKRPPQEITEENINNFRSQLQRLGLTFDWGREVNTTDPNYYKWTQWIFLKMYEKGLAYKKEMPINWCPKCKIGCANEEVIDGKHERCGTEVEKRMKSQWMMKITEYADRLIDELDETDYLESIKSSQRNWIGRKPWVDINYQVEDSDEIITVSTTRPDTQFGASFVVVAPEHEILDKLSSKMPKENWKQVQEYREKASRKSDLDRIVGSEKSGVFTGIYCINSITEQRLPIYVTDFVLTTVGTGMVVGVPAHDSRDFEFAQLFNLPVKRVIVGPDGDDSPIDSLDKVYEDEGTVIESGFMTGLSTQDARKKFAEYAEEKGVGKEVVRYHLEDWVFSRQRYWGEPVPIVHCEKCGMVALPEDQLPLELPQVDSYEPTETGESPLANMKDWVNTTCPKCGGPAKRETDTMPQWAGSSWYFLRYCDPHNSDKLGDMDKLKYWMPVDHYEGGQEHITLHLLYSRFWHKVLNDLGYAPGKEPYKKRTTHGMVLGEGGAKMSKSLGNVINPDQLVDEYGADVARAYLLFMGPYDGDVAWNTRTIQGVNRFASKLYTYLLEAWEKDSKDDDGVDVGINRLVDRVERGIVDIKFNTVIAGLMEFYNDFSKKNISRNNLEKLIITIAPIMPHMAEEIWSTTGHNYSVHQQAWPKVDESLLVEDEIEVPIQINGKVKTRISIPKESTEEEVKEIVNTAGILDQYVQQNTIKKFIYVPGRIINIVV
jgi:leucyl-tRNA synthetase